MPINKLENVKPGDLYKNKSGDVFRVIAVSEHPTVTLHNLDTHDPQAEVTFCIGSPISEEYAKLVEEK